MYHHGGWLARPRRWGPSLSLRTGDGGVPGSRVHHPERAGVPLKAYPQGRAADESWIHMGIRDLSQRHIEQRAQPRSSEGLGQSAIGHSSLEEKSMGGQEQEPVPLPHAAPFLP